ncbi:MAG: peptidase MA family metallohydrolase [Acidobacteriota bacterium]
MKPGRIFCILIPAFFLIFPIPAYSKHEENSPELRSFNALQNRYMNIYFDTAKSGRISSIILGASAGIFPRFEEDFRIRLDGKVTLLVLSESEESRKSVPIGYEPDWAAGKAYPSERLMAIIVERLGFYPDMDAVSVFAHELSHIYLYHSMKESGIFVPRWFDEGVAMLQARRWGMRDHYELVSSLITGTYIPLDALRGSFPEDRYEAKKAYVESFSFLSYLSENYGEYSISLLIAEMQKGNDFDSAFAAIIGADLRGVERRWISRTTLWYRWIPIATSSITLWIGITLLFLLGYLRKKRRNRETLKSWEEDYWEQ